MLDRAPVLFLSLLLGLTAVACDSGSDADAGSGTDSGATTDAGTMDAGERDAGPDDAGPEDAGPEDAGPDDAGPTDSGPEDGGPIDASAGDASTGDAGADAGDIDAGPADAGMSDAGPADAGPLTCTEGTEAAIGQLCVTGVSDTGEVTFQVTPEGCRSSSCTIRYTTRCDATLSGSDFDLTALFCLGGTGDLICTSDCNGGGVANCSVLDVTPGTYTATLGGLSVTFSVPLTDVPLGGICDGSPF